MNERFGVGQPCCCFSHQPSRLQTLYLAQGNNERQQAPEAHLILREPGCRARRALFEQAPPV
jgi:hypothetical protein